MWHVDERVIAYPNGEGLSVICTTNRAENQQDWKGIQFISTAAVDAVNGIVNYLRKYVCDRTMLAELNALFSCLELVGYLLCFASASVDFLEIVMKK